jgi:hypothetical protein
VVNHEGREVSNSPRGYAWANSITYF